jgi:hypothetical protein
MSASAAAIASVCHVMIRCHEATPGNVDIAKALNIWATITPHNKNLEDIWSTYSTIYLYFNVYKRPFFSGVAKMTSGITGDFFSGWKGTPERYGPTFTLEWIEKEVIIGDDDFDWLGTEDTAIIEERTGKNLLKRFINEGNSNENTSDVVREAIEYTRL